MPLARKKPVTISYEIWPGRDDEEQAGRCAAFLQMGNAEFHVADDCKLQIHTLEGVMEANGGDFVIKGVNGEFYPCKPDIFEKTYDYPV